MSAKSCRRCGETKDLSEFSVRNPLCKPCRAEHAREQRKANPEAARAAEKRWRGANGGRKRQLRRAADPETLRASWRAASAKTRDSRKGQVFAHYGTACACCGSTSDLQIDHVNGDGKAHRAQVGQGSDLYRWLVSNGFPPGFQTLCRPCNYSKGRGAACTLNHDISGTAAV